jgi:hypothetical protein
MKSCPFCKESIPEESRVCKACSRPLVRRCPVCAEENPAAARACRACRSLLDGTAADAPQAPRAPRAVGGALGEERGVVSTVVLSLLTCGIYGMVVMYRIGEELNAHRERRDTNPGVDLLLAIVTCNLWGIYLMYKYPRLLQETMAEEGMPTSDIGVACLLLSIFGFRVVALAILQSELNKHWEAHRAPRAEAR